jgi:hypothetical protein
MGTHSLERTGWHVVQSAGGGDGGGRRTHKLETTGGTWHSQLAGTMAEQRMGTHSLERMGWHVVQSAGGGDGGGCRTHKLEMGQCVVQLAGRDNGRAEDAGFTRWRGQGDVWHGQLAGTMVEHVRLTAWR